MPAPWLQTKLTLIALAVVALVVAALLGCAQARQSVYLPPDEFLHPFAGRTVVMTLPPDAPALSLSVHDAALCCIWLSRPSPCLMAVETANCNGAIDVNNPAVRARMTAEERRAYGRTCQVSAL